MALRFWRVQMLWANSMLPTLRPRIASSMNSISMLASLFRRTRPERRRSRRHGVLLVGSSSPRAGIRSHVAVDGVEKVMRRVHCALLDGDQTRVLTCIAYGTDVDADLVRQAGRGYPIGKSDLVRGAGDEPVSIGVRTARLTAKGDRVRRSRSRSRVRVPSRGRRSLRRPAAPRTGAASAGCPAPEGTAPSCHCRSSSNGCAGRRCRAAEP